ncbi:bifunctional diaminohydroxyphosphoribosylaminopyrimidine deaminase/5-amino-6-(5-phosphoribosylamino)uracil reductase RibD [Bacillus shivajii]|uniref:bifunctional diaminohydroxyphosphoribosylaminopyrimidine deaminase/5-amino-6-(5-phosphoribosylamino)uracil reductase RibD n=1 Tax=Bacillus shivajii TaxID=1983719 RepID=UPI001CFB76D5|nr:bifunctional diaminohydroxyphosphoribosylaminopyrimidine deaminase/5-amino-6-(5-phosphoribosylamino)uracil reductase RibD [Bacillus shivajii]UCZ54703.1 bifunctional diaminohydroxyphosphoribosylaminopyrimidine deaminase/5-amino-6-(5-phosphoribosylamino)uracil reductase RibD [Bacillus shivajii]
MKDHYMKIAIDLAKSTTGQTSPNPVVGAVIVNDHQVVGMGAHLKAGENHAERNAIEMAKEKCRGATIYVTLEPCSHHGRTPPCADAIIEAGIRKVVVASVDPNPKVAGSGIQKLREANIEVETNMMKEEADAINKVFFHYIQTKKPFVTLKSATSLDGKIATNTGESQWITGEEARYDVHNLRHEHDSILVGVNTVLVDNPSLTTRLSDGGKNPIRIVLDHHLRIPLDAKLLTDQKAKTWIVTTKHADPSKVERLKQLGAEVLQLNEDKIEVPSLLKLLGEKEVTSLLVEGGGIVNDSFLRLGEYQEVVVYLAPTIIGGNHAPSSFSGKGFSLLKDTPNLQIEDMKRLGKDLKIILKKGED